MATTTTNFGWDIPQSTDLVKDGATAIAALGQDIDTALVDLKGGTTGQVLAKASNSDLDFTWTADASGIPATIFDAKGDLIAASAADTAARLAVGTNGQVLTADSTETTGLKWATPSSGAYTELATGSLSGTLTLSSISSSYRDLVLVITGATWSTTYAQFAFRYNNNSSANVYKTGLQGYYGTSSSAQSTYNWSEISDYNRVYINGEWQNTNGKNHQVLIIKDYATAKYPIIEYQASYQNNNNYITFAYGAFTADIESAINRIDVFMTSSLSFNGGSYKLYGVK